MMPVFISHSTYYLAGYFKLLRSMANVIKKGMAGLCRIFASVYIYVDTLVGMSSIVLLCMR